MRSELRKNNKKKLTFRTVVLRWSESQFKNLTTCKTVSIETPTQHSIYDEYILASIYTFI